MVPWEILGRALAPEGNELVLARRGAEHSIRADNSELMSSRRHGSEESLARLACKHLASAASPRVLVGGLGMGYTLRAALDALPTGARVVVAEVVPAVVEWNRGPLAHLAGAPLTDPRVTVEARDVGLLLGPAAAFDAIILDVDNGPAALTRKPNERLYGPRGLERARKALAPGGVLAVWSASPHDVFPERLRAAGLAPETHVVPARPGMTRERHTVYLGRLLA